MARQYLSSPEEFRQTARYWAENFALQRDGTEAKIERLVDMGFGTEAVRKALERYGGDEAAAMDALLA